MKLTVGGESEVSTVSKAGKRSEKTSREILAKLENPIGRIISEWRTITSALTKVTN